MISDPVSLLGVLKQAWRYKDSGMAPTPTPGVLTHKTASLERAEQHVASVAYQTLHRNCYDNPAQGVSNVYILGAL